MAKSKEQFKSKAQVSKFMELVQEGRITPQQFDRWVMNTKVNSLPNRVERK